MNVAKLRSRRQAHRRVVRINKTYLQLYGINTRYVVVYGGRRSSKSYSVSQLLVRKAIENPGRMIVVMRKVATTLRLSVWKRVIDALDEAGILEYCDINKSDRSILLPNNSSFEFVGADDPQKLKSLEGATDFWLEEANEFEEIDLDTIDAGMSADVDPCCQIWLTFNPVPIIEQALPWLATRFVLRIPHDLSIAKVDGDVCILRTWYKDNHFCPDAIVKLFKSYEHDNPELYKLWVLGVYTHLEGVIFTKWDVVERVPHKLDDKGNATKDLDSGIKFLGYGLDFGFAEDPAALISVWVRGLNTNKPEAWLRQDVYETQLNNQQLGARMRELDVHRYDEIIADSAEPKSIDEIHRMGFNIHPSIKGPDSVRLGITRMQGIQFHILRGSTDLIKEFSVYSWKKDKNGKTLPSPIGEFDHGISAARYRLTTKGRTLQVGQPVASSLGL